jgi:hypothetical protein
LSQNTIVSNANVEAFQKQPAPGKPPAGEVYLYADLITGALTSIDSSGNTYTVSGPAGGIPSGATGSVTVASGAVALGTALIASGAAAATVTVTAAGVLATDNVAADFNANPTGVVGYQPSANGCLTIFKYPTAGAVNFVVVNNTGASITPGAITLNWRAIR